MKPQLNRFRKIIERKINKRLKEVFLILEIYLEIIEVLEVQDMTLIIEPQILISNHNYLNSQIYSKSNRMASNIKKSNIKDQNDSKSTIINSNLNKSKINNSTLAYVNNSNYFNHENQIIRYDNTLKNNLERITTIGDINQDENMKSSYILKSISCINNKNSQKSFTKPINVISQPKIVENNKQVKSSQILQSYVIDSNKNFKNPNIYKSNNKTNLFKINHPNKYFISPSVSSLLISEHKFK